MLLLSVIASSGLYSRLIRTSKPLSQLFEHGIPYWSHGSGVMFFSMTTLKIGCFFFKNTTHTLCLFNIAMGNGPCIEVYLLKMVIFHGYVNNQMVIIFTNLRWIPNYILSMGDIYIYIYLFIYIYVYIYIS